MGAGHFLCTIFDRHFIYHHAHLPHQRFPQKRQGQRECFLAYRHRNACILYVLRNCQPFFFLTWAGAAIYLVLYYLLININNSSRDPLTGAFNRAVYMKALSEIDRSISCTIAMLDINNFKQINDVQGHAAGDQYLVNFVGILQEEMEKGTSLYRVGGDEFVVLSKKWDEGYLRQRLEHAREQAQIHHLSFAYGTISYQPSDILDDVLILADQKCTGIKSR